MLRWYRESAREKQLQARLQLGDPVQHQASSRYELSAPELECNAAPSRSLAELSSSLGLTKHPAVPFAVPSRSPTVPLAHSGYRHVFIPDIYARLACLIDN